MSVLSRLQLRSSHRAPVVFPTGHAANPRVAALGIHKHRPGLVVSRRIDDLPAAPVERGIAAHNKEQHRKNQDSHTQSVPLRAPGCQMNARAGREAVAC